VGAFFSCEKAFTPFSGIVLSNVKRPTCIPKPFQIQADESSDEEEVVREENTARKAPALIAFSQIV
jgi:hypothetical protein